MPRLWTHKHGWLDFDPLDKWHKNASVWIQTDEDGICLTWEPDDKSALFKAAELFEAWAQRCREEAEK